jgi:hypothetical protein
MTMLIEWPILEPLQQGRGRWRADGDHDLAAGAPWVCRNPCPLVLDQGYLFSRPVACEGFERLL